MNIQITKFETLVCIWHLPGYVILNASLTLSFNCIRRAFFSATYLYNIHATLDVRSTQTESLSGLLLNFVGFFQNTLPIIFY